MAHSSDIYFPADEAEKLFLTCIWRVQEYNMGQRTETILPKGTVEIIFNLSDSIKYINPDLNIGKVVPRCYINGINFTPFHLVKSGEPQFLGIQLNYIGLKCLFDVNVKEFNNNVIEGSEVCKSLEVLYGRLFLKKTFNEQVEIIRNWIGQRISASKHYKAIHQIHHLFYSPRPNNITISELCLEKRITDRQLRRLSAEWLGMNTEAFLLYNKYISALNLLHSPSGLSLTQIGLEAGYYDQSHFIREFKSYTRLTPKEYQALITSDAQPGHIFR